MRKLKRFWAALMACLMMAVMLCASGCIIVVSDKAVEDGVDVVSLINFKDFRMRFYKAGLSYVVGENECVVKGRNGEGRVIEIPEAFDTRPVTQIDAAAFRGTNITKVTIGDNVSSIGVQAFYDCDELKKITIPENVTYIDTNAFKECDKLEKVTFEEKVGWYINGKMIDSSVLADKEKAAELLKVGYVWTRN